MSDNSLSSLIRRLAVDAGNMTFEEKFGRGINYLEKYYGLPRSSATVTAAYELSAVFAEFSGEITRDRETALRCVEICRRFCEYYPDNERIAHSLIRTLHSLLFVNSQCSADDGTEKLMDEAFAIARRFPDNADIITMLTLFVVRMMLMGRERIISKELACEALDRVESAVEPFPENCLIQGQFAQSLAYGCGIARTYERGTRLPRYCAKLRQMYDHVLRSDFQSFVRFDLDSAEEILRKEAEDEEDRRAGRIHMPLEELKAQIWNEDPEVAFRGVFQNDFDRLKVDPHSINGVPVLDEFEYLDARYENEAVEDRRREFFDWQRGRTEP